jgi:hypothetical protein
MIPALGSLHTGRLVLTPVDPLQVVDQTTIVTALRELGLAGPALDDDPARFAAGPALGAVVAFTGCAVRFDDTDAAAGPWLRVPPSSASPRLLWGRNSRPPRCPECAAPLRAWREQLSPAASRDLPGSGCDAGVALRCEACGAAPPAHRWRWGRHAGAGRGFVLIEEVFPGEARPLPPLMQTLAALGAGPWDFFYVQD